MAWRVTWRGACRGQRGSRRGNGGPVRRAMRRSCLRRRRRAGGRGSRSRGRPQPSPSLPRQSTLFSFECEKKKRTGHAAGSGCCQAVGAGVDVCERTGWAVDW